MYKKKIRKEMRKERKGKERGKKKGNVLVERLTEETIKFETIEVLELVFGW